MQERDAIEAESAAKLLDALLSGVELAEAVRGCVYGNPVFGIALFTIAAQSYFGPDGNPNKVASLITSIKIHQPGFPTPEAETLTRFVLGNFSLAGDVDPLALDYSEIVIAVLTAILREWHPRRAEVERLFEQASALLPVVFDQPFVRVNMDRWYASGLHASPFSSLATRDKDEDPAILTRRGIDFLEAGHTDAAIEAFGSAVAVDSAYMWAITSRGRAYSALDRHEEALADFNRALEIEPESASVLISRGASYRDLGRFDEALDDFAKAIELDEQWMPYARADRGAAYADMGRYAAAIEEYNAALPTYPDPASILYMRCMTYYELDDFDRALDDITQAIELSPEPVYYAQRGEVLRMMDRPLEALADFDRGTDPNSPKVWHFTSRADALQDLGRPDEALVACDRAVAGWPDRTEPYLARGSVYVDLGRIAEAKADFRHALELDPDLADHVQELLESADGEAGQAAG